MDELAALWLHPAYLLAGFGGAVCYAFRLKEATARTVGGALITGTLMANYGSALAERWLGAGTTAPLAAFGTGFCATFITEFFIKKAASWIGRYDDP